MEMMMAYCGVVCSDCKAYKATVNNSDALRKETAEEWSRVYGADIRPEHINCLGCNSEVQIWHCKVCEIRKCNRESEYDNCSQCHSFICGNLREVLRYDPGARERLLKLRDSL